MRHVRHLRRLPALAVLVTLLTGAAALAVPAQPAAARPQLSALPLPVSRSCAALVAHQPDGHQHSALPAKACSAVS